jgi:hypothetical protein
MQKSYRPHPPRQARGRQAGTASRGRWPTAGRSPRRRATTKAAPCHRIFPRPGASKREADGGGAAARRASSFSHRLPPAPPYRRHVLGGTRRRGPQGADRPGPACPPHLRRRGGRPVRPSPPGRAGGPGPSLTGEELAGASPAAGQSRVGLGAGRAGRGAEAVPSPGRGGPAPPPTDPALAPRGARPRRPPTRRLPPRAGAVATPPCNLFPPRLVSSRPGTGNAS